MSTVDLLDKIEDINIAMICSLDIDADLPNFINQFAALVCKYGNNIINQNENKL